MSTQFAVDLVFKTQGSNQLKDATSKIKNLETAAKKAQGGVKGAANNIRAFGATAKTASVGVKGMGAAFSSMLGPLALVTAAVAAVGKAISAAAEKEKQLQAMRQGLENLGVTGTEALGALEAKAKEFGETTLFSPAQYRDAVTSLTSFRNIAVKDFDEVIKVSADVAQAMGTNVKDASLQLAKALNAPTQNLSALSRSGIQFTQEQKEQIKAMEAAGNVAGAQALIMKELKLQYDGVSEAAGKGMAGAFDLLGQRIQEAFESFGKLLEPLAGPALAAAIGVVESLANMWEYIAAEIFPKVTNALKPITEQFEGTDWTGILNEIGMILSNTIIVALQGAITTLGNLSKILGTVIGAFKALADNPVFKFIAEQVGRVANMLGLSNGEMNKFVAGEKAAAAEADAILEGVQQIAPAVEKTYNNQKEVTNAIKESTSALDAQQKKQESIASMSFEIAQQRNAVEQAITGTLLEQAQAQLDGAKTQGERIKAAEAIYELTVRQAELEAAAAKGAVAESVRKVESQLNFLKLKEREIAAAVALAQADGVANEQHEKALQLAGAAVEEAATQVKLKKELAVLQNKEIDALLQGKINTAEMAYQQNIVANETERAAGSAGTFASNMGQAANQAERAAAAMGKSSSYTGMQGMSWHGGGHGARSTTAQSWGDGISQEAINHVLSQRSNVGAVQGDNGNWHVDFNNPFASRGGQFGDASAEMREVQALIDSGGLVAGINGGLTSANRQQMMQANAAAVAANKERLNAQPMPVAINYSGSTMNFDGNQYVNKSDVNGIVQQAVTAVNTNLQRSPKARLNIGI